MKLYKVLVVTKQSSLGHPPGGAPSEERVAAAAPGGKRAREAMVRAFDQHQAAVESVQTTLHRRGISFDLVDREEMAERIDPYDLVLAVGGDGTVLEASHYIQDGTPLLGVNSAPESSVGFLTAARADTLGGCLERLGSDELQPLTVLRLQVCIDGQPVGPPVLNDVLAVHQNPASTSRYAITVDGRTEEHRSSGVWLAGPAGTTAGIRSAGGEVLPVTARHWQYRVREPYRPPGAAPYELVGGVLGAERHVTVESHMDAGVVFLDGPHRMAPLGFGHILEVARHPCDLRLIFTHGKLP